MTVTEAMLKGLIDESSNVEENNASLYRAVDNNVSDSMPVLSTSLQAPLPPPPTVTLLTHEHEEVEEVERCFVVS